ncbi:MAG: ATP-binding protein [Bacteroidetes bacterium]|nr:ATP-binding protein [Bacteroidota bacterium]
MTQLIGREDEIKILNSLLQSDKSEFVAVFGRRRVGKTFLVREVFKDKFTFYITGLANSTLERQLLNFHTSLHDYGKPARDIPVLKNWFSAFRELISFLERSRSKKKIVFIDELPWLDTPKSGFLSALEHFWNSWASARSDILLIVCGSAISWMLNKLINNKGGLHNRVTYKLKVVPFTLKECEAFFKSRNVHLNRYQIIELYMAMGGIPYYLDAIRPGISVVQNIDSLFFSKNGLLRDEFFNLYASLFKHPENHVAVVTALSKKAKGLTREEIIHYANLTNGGGITKVLEELESSGFIMKYTPFKKRNKQSLFQLVDFYTLFYFKFICNQKTGKNYWQNSIDSPRHRAWSGYAFEQVCLMHMEQIKKELGISGVHTEESSWRSSGGENGTQIDLLIDRADQVINICEIKFSVGEFVIDKKYAQTLRNRISTFKTETGTRKSVFLTMITTYGTKTNTYALELINNNLTMNSLFE